MNKLVGLLLVLANLATSSPCRPDDPPMHPVNDSTTIGCAATSWTTPAWSISNFTFRASYTFTTPAHQNSWGYVDFFLGAPALAPSSAKCSASSSVLSNFFYGNVAYDCELPDAAAVVGGGTGGKATFEFNRADGLLRVNQTWTCHDVKDPRYPVTFFAFGSVNLDLKCSEDFYQNPDWPNGGVYSNRRIECEPVSLDLKPSEMAAIA